MRNKHFSATGMQTQMSNKNGLGSPLGIKKEKSMATI